MTACGVYPFENETVLGECSITMSVLSMFQILDGLLSKLLVEIKDPSSLKYLSNTTFDLHVALTSDSFRLC